MSLFVCPVCGKSLEKREKTYVCENLHSFDVSKKGYVNLLLASGAGKVHGDDKEMIRARADFLGRGFYDRLSEKVSSLAFENCAEGGVVLDAGCGEGKYTSDIAKCFMQSSSSVSVVGVDISKDAVNLAAGRDKNSVYAVASSAALPLADGSVDVIVNIFAPFFAPEFARVLSENGVVIRVYPLKRHLWELKELVYDVPYENPVTDMEEMGFVVSERLCVTYDMYLEKNEDIKSLFAMTPYFYRTSEKDAEKLSGLCGLSCRAEFGIAIYKKI